MPKVSVIVPNYNHAPFLRQRIDSILSQSYQDFELILLDDCSSDNSREILLEYKNNPKVSKVIFNEHNSGSTFRQWNKGISCALGEWIWIAESDDYAEPGFLETLLTSVENHPNCGLAFCSSRLINENGEITFENENGNRGNITVFNGLDFIQQRLSLKNDIWNASMMIFQKNCYPAADQRYLYEGMHYCGDWMFYVMIAEKSDVISVEKELNNFRQHDGNVSRKAEKAGLAWIEGLEVLRYVLPYQKQKIRTISLWCKNICRSHKRLSFSNEILMRIRSKFKSVSVLGWLMYFPISWIYSLKK